ncbi:hypothetical protein, partial [Burkholderia ubonensis]|uniref:hypothetical protein n=1 Tax=Burkholderia ubonensis TaxID=101571 RepID=UPI001E4636D6
HESGHLNLAKSGHYNLAATTRFGDNSRYVNLQSYAWPCDLGNQSPAVSSGNPFQAGIVRHVPR